MRTLIFTFLKLLHKNIPYLKTFINAHIVIFISTPHIEVFWDKQDLLCIYIGEQSLLWSERLHPLDRWCFWRLCFCSNWQYHRDHQEDYTFRYSLVAYYSTILMNPNAYAFYQIFTSSTSVPISPTPEHPTCLLSTSFFQENAVLHLEVLEEPEAQDPGPPPSTLHHSKYVLLLLGDLMRKGGHSRPLPDDGGCEHCLDLESAEASDLTLETSLSSDRALIQLWLTISL